MTRTHDERYRAMIGLLRATRQLASLSQAELADRIGQRQQFVSKYESGDRRLDVVEFSNIAKILGIPAASWLKGL